MIKTVAQALANYEKSLRLYKERGDQLKENYLVEVVRKEKPGYRVILRDTDRAFLERLESALHWMAQLLELTKDEIEFHDRQAGIKERLLSKVFR